MKPYYNEVYEFVNSFQTYSKPDFDILYNIAEIKILKPGEKLLDLGTVPQKVYLIADGVIRSYIILSTGKEVTTNLFSPLMVFASFRALIKKQTNHIIFEALTDCCIFELDFNAFYSLCKNDIKYMTLYSKFLEFIVLKGGERFIEYSSNNATQRYLLLRGKIPNLDNIIPQYQIAATLGITPVQLSRIRAKL